MGPVLRTTFTVAPCDHTVTFVIGDAGDNIYDSGVFISRGLGSSGDDDGTHEDPTPEPASLLALGGAIVAYAKRRRGARDSPALYPARRSLVGPDSSAARLADCSHWSVIALGRR